MPVARPRQSRHHRADGNIERAAHFTVSQLLHRHKQHHFALLDRQRAQGPVHILQLQLLRLHRPHRHHGWILHRHLDLVAAAPCLVHEDVVHDGEQPRAQIAARTPQIELVPGALQRVLHQIIRGITLADERPRVAPQPRNVLDDRVAVHRARVRLSVGKQGWGAGYSHCCKHRRFGAGRRNAGEFSAGRQRNPPRRGFRHRSSWRRSCA